MVSAIWAEADDEKIDFLLAEVNGKDITELIASGREKFASMPSGGGAIAVAPASAGGGASPAACSRFRARRARRSSWRVRRELEESPNGQKNKPGNIFPEKKEGINVLGWQIPGFKGEPLGYEPSKDGQFETAVAASAYAIKMVEEPDGFSQRRSLEGMDSKFKLSRRSEEGVISPPQLGSMSRRLSRKASKEGKQYTGEASSRTPEITPDGPKPGRTPTMGRTPTSTEKRKDSNGSGSVRPASRPTTYVAPRAPNKLESNNKEMKAASWEIAKLAQIQQRYDESMKSIEAWEKKRQRRAKYRLERKQEELERKLARATAEYRDEMKTANKIAGGARSQAEEKRRNEEMKVKERARQVRLTGEVPETCFCF